MHMFAVASLCVFVTLKRIEAEGNECAFELEVDPSAIEAFNLLSGVGRSDLL